jgi:hypothetical protein
MSRLKFTAALVFIALASALAKAQTAGEQREAKTAQLFERICGTLPNGEGDAAPSMDVLLKHGNCLNEVLFTLLSGIEEKCGREPGEQDAKAREAWLRCRDAQVATYDTLPKRKPSDASTNALQQLADGAARVAVQRITAITKNNTLQYKYESETRDMCIKGDVLMIPAGKDISFNISSLDDIYVWSVPGLAVNADAIPGRVNETILSAEAPETMAGIFAKTGGTAAEQTRILVRVVAVEDYAIWEKDVLPMKEVACF